MSGAAAIFQRRLGGPGKVGCRFCGGLCILTRRFVGAETICLHIETAQAEFAGFRILGHFLEKAARLVVTTFDQGCLGVEDTDQWFLVCADEATGTGAHSARKQGIAGASGNEPRRKRLIAAISLARTEEPADRMR